MRYFVLSLILLFSFSACGENEKHNTRPNQETKLQKDILLAEIKEKDLALKKALLETKALQEKLLLQEKAKQEALLKAQNQKRKKEKEEQQKEENEKFSKVGINIEKNIITIDTNKTKDFFRNIGDRLKEKLNKITSEIEKGLLDEKDAGIQIDETKINIDLNKTKDFLEKWGKQMQGFVKEFDNIAKEMDSNPQPSTQQ